MSEQLLVAAKSEMRKAPTTSLEVWITGAAECLLLALLAPSSASVAVRQARIALEEWERRSKVD